MQTEATREKHETQKFSTFYAAARVVAYPRFVISHLSPLSFSSPSSGAKKRNSRRKCLRSRGLAKDTVLSSLSLSLIDVRRAAVDGDGDANFVRAAFSIYQKFHTVRRQIRGSRRFAPARTTYGDKVFTPVITGNENMRAMPGIWVAGIIITL